MDKNPGVITMKIIISIIENLQVRIDHILPHLLNVCLSELNIQKPKAFKNFQSMILQVVCMCLWYNSPLTFQILE